jgi:formamidopyrimidine-DNA glycosylase
VEGELPSKVTHIVIGFDDGSKVFFNDLRQFGYAKLEPTAELSELPFIKSLGPEPLSSDFKLAGFTSSLRRRSKTPVKSAILDQSIAAGVGNIYADESLFVARVHPKRLVGSLSNEDVERIFKAIRSVLKEALRWGGTSIQAYVDTEGRKGTYLQHAWVYRRDGESCRECGGKIVKTTVGGRGTHFCPHCQPLEQELFEPGGSL